jgi:hypothetical protein
MKKILPAIFFFGWMRVARAQGASQANLEQIAALKAYISTVEEGSKIVQQGLFTIRDIRDKEFFLDGSFFRSFENVNPAVKDMPYILKVINRQQSFINYFGSRLAQWQISPWLSALELGNAGYFYKRMTHLMVQNLNNLRELITDQSYEMTDRERLQRIEQSLETLNNQRDLLDSFIDSMYALIVSRENYHDDVELLKKWYNLP